MQIMIRIALVIVMIAIHAEKIKRIVVICVANPIVSENVKKTHIHMKMK
jgi:hypothetical protein